MKKHNFSAGPCILPNEVLQKASEAVINFNNHSLSLLEISHRSQSFVDVIEKARLLALEHLNLGDKGYKTLFFQGGASLQFLMIAYNFLNKKAAYLNTGAWSTKAIKEARMFGNVTEVASSKDKNFSYISKSYSIPANVDYFHCTSNNTIYGTQIKEFPQVEVPLICDMSSDIFTRRLDFSKFDLVYAGAQKNMGTSGVTLVVIREKFLNKICREVPSMLNYKIHIEKDSMFNTPPVFSVYISMLTLEWLKELGGIDFIETVNKKKARLLYDEIDRNSLFKGIVAKEDRSTLNATFTITSKKLKSRFESLWKEAGINGLHGHRSVGDYRASMYNALPLYSVQTLVDVMTELERTA